jgi:hypothetical protein
LFDYFLIFLQTKQLSFQFLTSFLAFWFKKQGILLGSLSAFFASLQSFIEKCTNLKEKIGSSFKDCYLEGQGKVIPCKHIFLTYFESNLLLNPSAEVDLNDQQFLIGLYDEYVN